MESFAIPVLILVLTVFLLRLLFLPIRFIWKLLIHSGCGFLCLWLLNTTASLTGILLPVNAVTVTVAGFLGFPGIALIALLEYV